LIYSGYWISGIFHENYSGYFERNRFLLSLPSLIE
jgi:hypothetical protein